MRGGDFKSNIIAEDKMKIEEKLSNPKNGFTSYSQAQSWMKGHWGVIRMITPSINISNETLDYPPDEQVQVTDSCFP